MPTVSAAREAMGVRPFTIEDGMDVASWSSTGPWAVLDNLQPPPQDESFRAVEDAVGDLIEYCCFSVHGRVPGADEAPETLEVSFSMCPELLGEGLGAALARTVTEHVREIAVGRRLRCIIAEWNHAGRRIAEGAGFVPVGGRTSSERRATSSTPSWALPRVRRGLKPRPTGRPASTPDTIGVHCDPLRVP
jgi:RimJ/RimL family protein N-acetyltransferase